MFENKNICFQENYIQTPFIDPSHMQLYMLLITYFLV